MIPRRDIFAGESEQLATHVFDYAKRVPAYVPIPQTQIPDGEIARQRGAQVEATDGLVGRVDEFLVDLTNDRITYRVLRESHLWADATFTSPASPIDRLMGHTVYSKLNRQQIEKLAGVPVRSLS